MIHGSQLEGHPVDAARRLLGATLVSEVGERTAVRLVEVEAYAPDDPASHAFRGMTKRNRSMFAGAGTLYVYRSYGIHWCANVVTGGAGTGAAVLLRAGIPLEGRCTMIERRGRAANLADGPGKLCQAMGIDGSHDGLDLLDPSSPVRLDAGEPPSHVEVTPRIGISKGADLPWRFVARF